MTTIRNKCLLEGQCAEAAAVIERHQYVRPAVVTKTVISNGAVGWGFHFRVGAKVGDVYENDDHSVSQVIALVQKIDSGAAGIKVDAKTDDVFWLGGKRPESMTEAEFVATHRTGFIESHAYDRYQETGGLAWLGAKNDYPELLDIIFTPTGTIVELRQTGRVLQYVKPEVADEPFKDRVGETQYRSATEIALNRLNATDQLIAAFVGDEPVGHVCNEFGAVGVWVEARYQKMGIGAALMKRYLEMSPDVQIGQMTNVGEACVRRVHAQFVRQYSDVSNQLGLEAAKCSDQFVAGEDGYCDPSKAGWEEVPFFPLEKLGDRTEWSDFFTLECAAWEDEGEADRFDDMKDGNIVMPVVVLNRDGKYFVWDGNHRIGAAMRAGKTFIPAIVGTPHPSVENIVSNRSERIREVNHSMEIAP